MANHNDICYISGCYNLSTHRIKISSRNKDGRFSSMCGVRYLCQTHFKNIGRMQSKQDIPIIIEDWDYQRSV
jgi:hypothetical protein